MGEPDDGSITTYNDIWAETGKNSGNEHPDRMDKLNDGFQRYIGEYYWDAPVRTKIYFNRYRRKRPKVDASIFDSALSHTRRLDASEKKRRK